MLHLTGQDPIGKASRFIRSLPVVGGGGRWSWLAEADDDTLDERLYAELSEMARLNEGERRQRLRPLIEAEYSLPDETLHRITRVRLRTLLALDTAAAHRLADSYDSIMNSLPGEVAFRHAEMVQQVARDMGVEDEERLRALLPNEFGEKPGEVSVETPGPREPVEGYPRRRWSTFWRRRKARV
jgi:hypothetical protein